MDAILAIDLGTTGCKAAVYSTDGQQLASSYLEYNLISPRAEFVEQDANLWWTLTLQSIQQVLTQPKVAARSIGALSVSTQGLSFVPIDRSGRVLRNAISWLDTRATVEAERVGAQLGEVPIFELTGKRPAAAYMLPKLIWLREHEPEIYRGTFKFLMAHDFLIYRLCGATVTDYSMAGGTLLLDLHRLEWSKEILIAFALAHEKLPDLAWAGSVAGELAPSVADILGLKPGIPIVVGGQDQKCAALGASIQPGRATGSLGTASAISCLVDRPVLDPARHIPTFPFVVPGYWDLEAVVSTAGAALKWARETLFPNKNYRELDQLAGQSPPGANRTRFYPHLTGATSPLWQVKARGAFTGLSLATTMSDIARSVLEGIAFQIRSNIDVIQSLAPVEELVLFGGGAKSQFWANMISQIANKPVSVTTKVDVATWGACILAGFGAGLYRDRFDTGRAASLVAIATPSPAQVGDYDLLYQQYRDAEPNLLHVN